MANEDEGKPDAEKVKLEKAVSEALDKLGIDGTNPDPAGKGAADLAGKMPQQMLDLFSLVVEQARAKQAAATPVTPSAPAPEAGPSTPAEPTAFETAVQASVKKAIEGYVQGHVVGDEPTRTEITMDAAFLKTHGAGLLASVVQGFAQAIIPEKFEVELDQPTASTDQGEQSAPPADGEKKTVALKVDFGNLIGGFLTGLAKNVAVETAKGNDPQSPPKNHDDN